MERQTLQQQTPVYHVCQQCAGAGCAVCADLCILEGDLMPINGVIGDNACPHCGKADYDLACGCLNPFEYSSAVGDWVCGQ